MKLKQQNDESCLTEVSGFTWPGHIDLDITRVRDNYKTGNGIDFWRELVIRHAQLMDIYRPLISSCWKMLLNLVSRKVLTHHYLLKEIWGNTFINETQYLRVFVAQLRKKIEDDSNAPKYIITESGVGYRFIGN